MSYMSSLQSYSIRLRLLALIASALLPMIALIIYSAEHSRDRELELAVERLQQTADLIAADESRVVESVRQLLTAMATAPALVAGDNRACHTYLKSIHASYARYLVFARFDRRGERTCQSSAVPHPLELTDGSSLEAALRDGRFAVGTYQTMQVDGAEVPLLPFAYPVRNEAGGVVAVIAAALRLDWLDRQVQDVRLPPGMSVTLLDLQGMALATYPEGQQAVGMRVPWWTSVGVERRNLAVEGEVIALGRTGIGGLTVAVSQSRDEILATTMRLFWVKLGLGTAVLVGAAMTAWLFGEIAIAQRVRRLIEVVHRLETGDLKARCGGEAAAGEFNQLGQALNQMAEKLENKVVSLSAREARFRHEALHDTLTGLPNRRILEQTVPLWLKEAEADGGDPIAILLVDLDGFKQVNDKLGHGFGDAVLAAASQRLRGCTRTADLVARLGGDEFVVGLRGTQQQAAETARRIVDRLAMPLRIGNHQLQIGASVGIVTASNQMLPVPALLRMADMALYQAKADGRSTYRVWEGTTYPSAA